MKKIISVLLVIAVIFSLSACGKGKAEKASDESGKDTYGTTEYVTRMIQESVGGDIHLIQRAILL